jgi:PAS domain S-box-containing protein
MICWAELIFFGSQEIETQKALRTAYQYLALGFTFGMLFPTFAIIFVIMEHDWAFEIASAIDAHRANGLLYIIDTAPLFLGLFAWYAGIREERVVALKRMVEVDLDKYFQISTDLVAICDVEGRLVRCNQAFHTKLRYPPESLIGRPILEIILPEDRPAFEAAIPKGEGKTVDQNLPCRVRDAAGFEKDFRFLLANTGEGKLLLIGADITTLKDSERQLRRYATDLEMAIKELDEFAYALSHDLKSPLRAIHSLCEFIEEDILSGDPEVVRHHIANLKLRAQRLQNLMLGLLEYSSAVKDPDPVEQLALVPLVEKLLAGMPLPESFAVRVRDGSVDIRFQRKKLLLILEHLIRNAVQYHHLQKGTILIASQPVVGGWHLIVEDDGPGIALHLHKQAFTLFKTFSTPDQIDRVGIGLPLVKKVLETYGGSIHIDSTFQQGTRFVMFIPE